MEPEKAAQVFQDWALQEGFMAEGQSFNSTGPELAQVVPVFEAGRTLLRQKRVLAVGYNDATKEVIVYTKLAAPKGKKAISSVPSRIDDVAVRYRQGAHSFAGDTPPMPFGGPAYVVRNSGGVDRYTCGSSISVGNCVDAGTLGCLVTDGAGKFYGLSNNHVTASCSCADVGLPVVAPGLADVSAQNLAPFTLGFHSRALPMLLGSPTVVAIGQNTDAAIFEIHRPDRVTSYQGGFYDTPAATAPLSAGQTVEKVGRTTGLTTGYVNSKIVGAFSINYTAHQYGFSGNIFFNDVYVIVGTNDVFSDNGDSGSLITTVVNGQRNAVGIVFAGMADGQAPGGKITLALPLEPILRALNVTLVNGHNV